MPMGVNTVVCIPAYNEEDNIGRLLRDILDSDNNVDIIVADNGSTDSTVDIVSDFVSGSMGSVRLIFVKHGCGITGVYARLFEAALHYDYEYIIGMDAGYSHDPRDIYWFMKEIKNRECVFGSRFKGLYDAPTTRIIISMFGNFLSTLLLRLRSSDATSGFVAFKRHALEQVPFDKFLSKWYFYDTELKYYCKNMDTSEIPISYVSSKSCFKYSHIAESVSVLLRLSLRTLRDSIESSPDRRGFMFP